MERLEFDAVVESTPRGGGGAFVHLPVDARAVFGTRARFAVRAQFNGVAYRGSTMPNGDGTFCLGITKAMRAQAGAGIGDMVHVVIERDTEPRSVEVPDDLSEALRVARLAASFDRLSYSHRREFVASVLDARQAATRARRIASVVTALSEPRQLDDRR